MQGLLTHTVCGPEIKYYEKFTATPSSWILYRPMKITMCIELKGLNLQCVRQNIIIMTNSTNIKLQ